jgi:hypothetical protein
VTVPSHILSLREAHNMRVERLAEIDRRVMLVFRDGMTARDVYEEISGRYSYGLVDSCLRRLERRGVVVSHKLDTPPRLRQKTWRGPRRVKIYQRVEHQEMERVG